MLCAAPTSPSIHSRSHVAFQTTIQRCKRGLHAFEGTSQGAPALFQRPSRAQAGASRRCGDPRHHGSEASAAPAAAGGGRGGAGGGGRWAAGAGGGLGAVHGSNRHKLDAARFGCCTASWEPGPTRLPTREPAPPITPPAPAPCVQAPSCRTYVSKGQIQGATGSLQDVIAVQVGAGRWGGRGGAVLHTCACSAAFTTTNARTHPPACFHPPTGRLHPGRRLCDGGGVAPPHRSAQGES